MMLRLGRLGFSVVFSFLLFKEGKINHNEVFILLIHDQLFHILKVFCNCLYKPKYLRMWTL